MDSSETRSVWIVPNPDPTIFRFRCSRDVAHVIGRFMPARQDKLHKAFVCPVELVDEFAAFASAHALTVHGLDEIPRAIPRTERPPWCGQCEERTRLIGTVREDTGLEALVRCPRCHPDVPADKSPNGRAWTRGDRMPTVSGDAVAAGYGSGPRLVVDDERQAEINARGLAKVREELAKAKAAHPAGKGADEDGRLDVEATLAKLEQDYDGTGSPW